MPTLDYLMQYAQAMSRLQASHNQAQAQYDFGVGITEADRTRALRDWNFNKQSTDQTYLRPIIQRGMENSGWARQADSRYRTALANSHADIQEQYTQQRGQLEMQLQQALYEENLQRALLRSQLDTALSSALQGYF